MATLGSRGDVVKLVTAVNPALAHIWQQALIDEGIRCEVVGDFLDAGIGDIPGLRAELWVHRDDKVRAEQILNSTGDDRESLPEEEDE
jgi:hypothetical protein